MNHLEDGQVRLARDCAHNLVGTSQVFQACKRQMLVKAGNWLEHLERYIALGYVHDGSALEHDGGDGLPSPIDPALEIVGIGDVPGATAWDSATEKIWQWQDLVSMGKIEVVTVDPHTVAYFAHPHYSLPGMREVKP